MKSPTNGFELLEHLKQQNGQSVQKYSDLSRYLAFKAREKGIPYSGQFELTPLCNFDCKMCYVHLEPNQMNGHPLLPVETWKDLMRQAWEAGMQIVSLTGGECLTYPGFDELYLYLHELGCHVNVLTNGYLLNDERVQFFKKHKPAEIQISLYGWNDDVYERVTGRRAFSVVSKNIQKLIDANLHFSISITPSIYLGSDTIETMQITKDLFGSSMSINPELFSPREDTGRSGNKDNPCLEDYLKIYLKMNEINGVETKEIPEDSLPPYGSDIHECEECGLRCGAGRSGFVMNWKGEMVPCNRMLMIRAFPLEEGFTTAWRKINQAVNQWPRIPECEQCAYKITCNSCAAEALEYAEPGKQPIGLCERTKYLVQHGIKHIPDCE